MLAQYTEYANIGGNKNGSIRTNKTRIIGIAV